MPASRVLAILTEVMRAGKTSKRETRTSTDCLNVSGGASFIRDPSEENDSIVVVQPNDVRWISFREALTSRDATLDLSSGSEYP
jgi:hypothetical protein